MLYVIPPGLISALAIFGLILCFFSFHKAEKMVRSSLVLMLKLGVIHLGSSMFLIGSLYLYYSIGEIDASLHSVFMRWALSYILLSMDIGQIILLRYGKNL